MPKTPAITFPERMHAMGEIAEVRLEASDPASRGILETRARPCLILGALPAPHRHSLSTKGVPEGRAAEPLGCHCAVLTAVEPGAAGYFCKGPDRQCCRPCRPDVCAGRSPLCCCSHR